MWTRIRMPTARIGYSSYRLDFLSHKSLLTCYTSSLIPPRVSTTDCHVFPHYLSHNALLSIYPTMPYYLSISLCPIIYLSHNALLSIPQCPIIYPTMPYYLSHYALLSIYPTMPYYLSHNALYLLHFLMDSTSRFQDRFEHSSRNSSTLSRLSRPRVISSLRRRMSSLYKHNMVLISSHSMQHIFINFICIV